MPFSVRRSRSPFLGAPRAPAAGSAPPADPPKEDEQTVPLPDYMARFYSGLELFAIPKLLETESVLGYEELGLAREEFGIHVASAPDVLLEYFCSSIFCSRDHSDTY